MAAPPASTDGRGSMVTVSSRTETPEHEPGDERGLARYLRVAREFFYGMTGLEFTHHALEMRADVENLFMLATLGDLLGVPIMPPYYSLRLLPFVMPQITGWRRRVLREKHFTELHDFDLHGL